MHKHSEVITTVVPGTVCSAKGYKVAYPTCPVHTESDVSQRLAAVRVRMRTRTIKCAFSVVVLGLLFAPRWLPLDRGVLDAVAT